MVALADGVADYVSGAGRSFKVGLRRGMDFQTEAPSDIAAYRAELEGMSGVKKIAYGLGDMAGEALNLVCLGVPELMSYNKLVDGDSGFGYCSVDSGDSLEASRRRIDAAVREYVAKYGDSEDESSEGGDLEVKVGGSDVKATRKRLNNIIEKHYTESGDSVRDYEAVEKPERSKKKEKKKRDNGYSSTRNVEDRIEIQHRRDINKARKENEARAYEINDTYIDLDFEAVWDGDKDILRRVIKQRNALGTNLGKIENLSIEDIEKCVNAAYVSNLGVYAVFPLNYGGMRPTRGRALVEEDEDIIWNKLGYNIEGEK